MYTLFDKDKFMSNFSGMEDLAKEIIQTFIDTVPTLTSSLEKAIRENKSKDLEISAHTLKGAVSNFHAESIRQKAWKLEELGKNGKFDNVETIYKELSEDLNQLLKELESLSKSIK